MDDLDEAQLDALLRELAADAEARRLVYEYMARRFGTRTPASLEVARRKRAENASDAMSRAEALDILELEEGAPENAIIDAYERLIATAQSDDSDDQARANLIERAKAILLNE